MPLTEIFSERISESLKKGAPIGYRGKGIQYDMSLQK